MDRAFFVGSEFHAMLLTIVARRDGEGETVVMLSLEGVEFFGSSNFAIRSKYVHYTVRLRPLFLFENRNYKLLCDLIDVCFSLNGRLLL